MGLLKRWTDFEREAGCDEVGRGCLCGPVVAASVVLGKDFEEELINDSKKLTSKVREQMAVYIKENVESYAIAELPPSYIDEHNILNASIDAMHLSLSRLSVVPDFILVDGNRFKSYQNIPFECIVKGDSKLLSIAAASILAKTYRDELMIRLHEEFPQYGWNKNFGYPTKQHQKALFEYGVTPYHRKSFRLDYSDNFIKKASF